MTLAEYIEQDLRARILAGQDLPARLTLPALSAQYRVSFTPVREAVDALVRQKVLVKGKSGRLTIPATVPRGRRAAREVPPARPLNDWHGVIARDVLRRSLQGSEDFLREESTAEEHGVSRTVLRQVFNRLVGAGLLEHVPRRGWRVRPFQEEDLEAYLAVREMMERKALELARPRLVREDLERMLAFNAPRPPREAQVDRELHPYLVNRSGNRFVKDFFERHGAYYTTLFYAAARGAAVVTEMAEHHRVILQALLDKDWSRAEEALGNHIRAQGPVVRKMMRRLAALPIEQWPDLDADEPSTGS